MLQLLVFVEKEFRSEVTRMDKMVLVVRMVLLIMMLMSQLAITAFLVKSGCPDQCGEIRIPYPFGTKRETSGSELNATKLPTLRQLL